MGKSILEIQNLTKYYGKIRGVEDLSLKFLAVVHYDKKELV